MKESYSYKTVALSSSLNQFPPPPPPPPHHLYFHCFSHSQITIPLLLLFLKLYHTVHSSNSSSFSCLPSSILLLSYVPLKPSSSSLYLLLPLSLCPTLSHVSLSVAISNARDRLLCLFITFPVSLHLTHQFYPQDTGWEGCSKQEVPCQICFACFDHSPFLLKVGRVFLVDQARFKVCVTFSQRS